MGPYSMSDIYLLVFMCFIHQSLSSPAIHTGSYSSRIFLCHLKQMHCMAPCSGQECSSTCTARGLFFRCVYKCGDITRNCKRPAPAPIPAPAPPRPPAPVVSPAPSPTPAQATPNSVQAVIKDIQDVTGQIVEIETSLANIDEAPVSLQGQLNTTLTTVKNSLEAKKETMLGYLGTLLGRKIEVAENLDCVELSERIADLTKAKNESRKVVVDLIRLLTTSA